MGNTKYMALNVKIAAADRARLAGKTNVSAWVRNAIHEKLDRERPESEYHPKTKAAKSLKAARAAYAARGGRWLSDEEVIAEKALRRGHQ